MCAGDVQSARFLANLAHFSRLLRNSGILSSTAHISDLGQALQYIDLSSRLDFYHTCRCILLREIEQLDTFDQIFELCWGGRIEYQIEMAAVNQRSLKAGAEGILPKSERSVMKGNADQESSPPEENQAGQENRVQPVYSPLERFFTKDFASFTEEEVLQARRLVEQLGLQSKPRPTRRKIPAFKHTGLLDLRRTVRQSSSTDGEIIYLRWRRRKVKPRPLVVLCDISGSMERYSRLFLRFLYALVQYNQRVEVFAFGTRLTYLTPALRHREVDFALQQTSKLVVDWSGGTRIGESLKTFNFEWSRRVLRRSPYVIIISDGWDRGDVRLLEGEMARLRRSAGHLIWLNPLAGAPDFQPLVRGLQAAMPYLDEFLPLSNLNNLVDLADRLAKLQTIGKLH